MSLKIGIVGLPNVGKSTLFNSLTRAQAEAKNFPFTTIDPNVGIVPVPDPRFDELVKIFNPEKSTPAVVEFVDIAGLIKGAAAGEGLGNKFLSNIREVDAVVHVVRGFGDKNVQHVHGKVDPLEDIEIINTELGLSDLEHPEAPKLTDKPTIYALNVSEHESAVEIEKLADEIKEKTGASVIIFNAKIEDELNKLGEADREQMKKELGVAESGLNRLIQEGYKLLGLISFFTAGPKEVRAWTVRDGATAPEAAGKIHTDMQRGFIAAEIINFDEFINHGSLETAKSAGKVRTEGKTYVMKDGDIVVFRFNV